MKSLLIIIILISFSAHSENKQTREHWACTDDSSQRDGNVWYMCGVAKSNNEAIARRLALKNSLEEFETICAIDSDCKDHKRSVEPKRVTCISNKDKSGWKCWRMLKITVLE